MTNFIKQLFDSLDKLFDILSLGRIIFYTAAGLLAFYPVVMIFDLLIGEPPIGFFQSMKLEIMVDPWLMFFAALVVGFVISNVGFATIIKPLSEDVRDKLRNYSPAKTGFNYRYPFLRNEPEQDYQAWLIAEYFRYIEIATFVPLGFFVGVGLLAGYAVLFLVYFGMEEPLGTSLPALLFFLIVMTVLGILRFHLWPKFWVPRVLAPTIATYFRAKIALIEGVEAYEASRRHTSAEATKTTT